MSPYDSDDLTQMIEEREGRFLVYRPPASAEHYPNYERISKGEFVLAALTISGKFGDLCSGEVLHIATIS
jgi:hypothetical protein